MVTIGFDASTSCIGFAFTEDGRVLDCGFLDISKLKTNKEKSFFVIDFLSKNPLISKIEKINLETSLSGFAGGFTRQQVIIKLARFNAVFEYIISEHYKIDVSLVNASTARKKLFGKSRIKGIKPKEYVKDRIEKMFDLSKWVKNNRKGVPDKKMQDVYDAIVISLWSL